MNKSGFTLIELVAVIVIFVILGAAAIFGLRLFQNKNRVDAAAQEIVAALRLAQNKTLASEGNSSYGVHFESDRFILFSGTSYIAGAPGNSEHLLDSWLVISGINLNSSGITAVVFERLTGNTANAGSITVSLANDALEYETIYIDGSGVITLQAGGASDSDRLKNSRHVHVIYSQDTQSAANLVLNFIDDAFSQNINYQAYLNPTKTEFSWQEDITVAGVVQQLSIHSHWLTPTSTTFCIHRDRRYNDKALQINLDGQNIINYTATGTTTPGTSVWAGEPEAQ